ncbi:MAG TPA: hypothetical protein VI322_05000 [Candidatus Saccharimonadia bacterium]
MRIHDQIWLEGAFYVDFDMNDELRIVGPGNHLVYGSTGLTAAGLHVLDVAPDVAPDGAEIALKLRLDVPDNFLPDPTMGHIRRIRLYTQIFGQVEPTYASLAQNHPGELAPNEVTTEVPDGRGPVVTYLRRYGEHYYGTRWYWPAGVQLARDNARRGFTVSGARGPVELRLVTTTDVHPPQFIGRLWHNPAAIDRATEPLLRRATAEIEHLVTNYKTSGFDYGTVFPRDWIETADLLAPQLSPAALRFMYTESLRHVSDDGAGWHEDIIGEYRYEREQEVAGLRSNLGDLVGQGSAHREQFDSVLRQLDELFVTRQMIDIEPHYVLGLRLVEPTDFSNDALVHLRQVGRYLVNMADSHRLITFKQLAAPFRRQRGDEYYDAGNWRDSTLAFQKIDSVIAPFDVNVVLYPQALRVLRRHYKLLGLKPDQLDHLITKWDGVREHFRFTNADGLPAYALALYGVRDNVTGLHFKRLKVNHLDEAFDLFYGEPSQADVVSFAHRLLSPDYFRTNSGPTLVGHHDGYDHSQYHGDVIWAKQAAFAAEGLARQIARGQAAGWTADTLELLASARHDVADTSWRAFRVMHAIPELHYDDDGRARLYIDQPAPEGQMNTVQLWSAAGAWRLWEATNGHKVDKRG